MSLKAKDSVHFDIHLAWRASACVKMEDSHITLKIIDKSGSILSETTCEITENNLSCLIASLKKVQKEINVHLTKLVDSNDTGQAVGTGEEEEDSEDEETSEGEEEKELHTVKKLKTK